MFKLVQVWVQERKKKETPSQFSHSKNLQTQELWIELLGEAIFIANPNN